MTRRNEDTSLTWLEDQVVARLRHEGVLERPARWSRSPWMVAAALAIALAALWAVHAARSMPEGKVYILALYSDEAYRAAPAEDRSRALEYSAWARTHRDTAASVIGGEELQPALASFGGAPAPARELVGFFTIRARTAADAVALAKTTPHLRYGGAVTVRPAVS